MSKIYGIKLGLLSINSHLMSDQMIWFEQNQIPQLNLLSLCDTIVRSKVTIIGTFFFPGNFSMIPALHS